MVSACKIVKENNAKWGKDMKKLYTLTFVPIVLLLMAASVTAESESNQSIKERVKTNSMEAYARWNPAAGETIIDVTQTGDGTTVITLTLRDPQSGRNAWVGRLTTQDKIFSMSPNLKSASLSAFPIDVTELRTGETKTLIVKVDWTGTGDIQIDKFKDKEKDKGTGSSFVSKVETGYNGATSTGSIQDDENIINLEESIQADLHTYMESDVTKIK